MPLQLVYYGQDSPPNFPAFGGQRQQLITAMPPLEGGG